ncbi:MAG: cytosine permease [Candidatus Saccharibacteria bacterium]|nr:cytosine permease [Microbacteriaceae bacterium]
MTDRVGKGIETRSIDYVPQSERYGKPWHLGAVWLMGTASVGSVAIGFIGVSAGANLLWTLVGVTLGALFGTIFSAFHSAQGPQLGLPQMVQSRPQFGYRGAVLVWVFVLVSYVGYNAFVAILGGQTVASFTGVGADGRIWAPVITLIGLVLAVAGYDLIHRVSRWFAGIFLLVYSVFTVSLIGVDLPVDAFDPSAFKATPFLLQFAVSAGYLISWAPYVSDYSRYLPATVSVRSAFWWTYLGMALSSIWLLSIGAVIGVGYPGLGVIETVRVAGDHLFAGFGAVLLIVSLPGLLIVLGLNLYGGSLTLLSIIDSFKRIRPTRVARVTSLLGVAITGEALVYAVSDNFLADFGTFLTFLLYLFGPWTAINLVDFYVVRKGHYSIRSIFDPNGIYGLWGWRGISAYLIGFAATVPFQSTTIYTGPVAKALNGVDFAPYVGIAVAGFVYWIFTQSLDLGAERALIDQTDVGIDATPHGEFVPTN